MNYLDIDISKLKPIAVDCDIDYEIDTSQRECLKSTFLLKGNLCSTLKCIAINSGLINQSVSALETDLILMHNRQDTIYTYIKLPHGSRKTLSAMARKFFLLEVSVINEIKNFKVYATQYKAKYQQEAELFFNVKSYYNGLLMMKDKLPKSQLSLMLNNEEQNEEENADEIQSEVLSGTTSEYNLSDHEIDHLTSKIDEDRLDEIYMKMKAKYQGISKSKNPSPGDRNKAQKQSTAKKSPNMLNKRTDADLNDSSFEPTLAKKINSGPTEANIPKKTLWRRIFGK